ncbi:MAG: trigger factor [Syntrophomonadaceae bacterium]|nr:trigger factor [Syntrophomonadaceae bacterium]MDH7497594.1 trigger factor [Syntrophomonadaceae bacterium]
MKSRLERLENNTVKLEVEVPQEQVEEALDRAFRKVVKQVSIPGFRKGRAPRHVVEAYFGRQVLYDDALEELIPAAYEQAVKENGVEPVASPSIDIVQLEEGKPLVFTAQVVVKPEVVLGPVEGLKINVTPVTVSEAEIDQRLQYMRERYARLVKVEGPAQRGDVLTIDFEGFIDGEAFPGGKGEDYSLELGSGTFIPGFEDQLVGAVAGEEREVRVTFPADYQAEELAGREAVFRVTVKEGKRRELSELDDAFAQEVSEFDTLEELRADIRKNLEQVAAQRTQQLIKDEAIRQVVEGAQVDIPREMIDRQVELMLGQFQERLAYQGMSLEQYLQMTGATIEQLQEEFAPQAEQIVRNNLVLEKVGEQAGIEVGDEDFQRHIDKVAGEFGLTAESVRQRVQPSRARIEQGLRLDKAVEYVVSKAVLETPAAEEPAAVTE